MAYKLHVVQQPHAREDCEGAWHQGIAASLVAGKVGFVQQQYIQALVGQVMRRRRSTRPGTDDDDIKMGGTAARSGFRRIGL